MSPSPRHHFIWPAAALALGLSSCTTLEEQPPPPSSSGFPSETRYNEPQATENENQASHETSDQASIDEPAPVDPMDELKNENPDATSNGEEETGEGSGTETEDPETSDPDSGDETSTPDGDGAEANPEELPFGIPVPGRPGTVYSPYDRTAGFVDVSGLAPGTVVTDPYTGNQFKVP